MTTIRSQFEGEGYVPAEALSAADLLPVAANSLAFPGQVRESREALTYFFSMVGFNQTFEGFQRRVEEFFSHYPNSLSSIHEIQGDPKFVALKDEWLHTILPLYAALKHKMPADVQSCRDSGNLNGSRNDVNIVAQEFQRLAERIVEVRASLSLASLYPAHPAPQPQATA